VEEGDVGEFVNDQLDLGDIVNKNDEGGMTEIVNLINKPRRIAVEKPSPQPKNKRRMISQDTERTFYKLGEYDCHSESEDLRDQLVEMSELHYDIGKNAHSLKEDERKFHIEASKMVSMCY